MTDIQDQQITRAADKLKKGRYVANLLLAAAAEIMLKEYDYEEHVLPDSSNGAPYMRAYVPPGEPSHHGEAGREMSAPDIRRIVAALDRLDNRVAALDNRVAALGNRVGNVERLAGAGAQQIQWAVLVLACVMGLATILTMGVVGIGTVAAPVLVAIMEVML